MRRLSLLVLGLWVAGCGDDDAPLDAAPREDAPECPASCDDGQFCNGEERCVDGVCVEGAAPCAGSCDEAEDACDDSCLDEDGDGAESVACGGLDCDDGDENVRPGATEICDVDGRDEDCDPRTFGFRDADGDGVADALCCNGETCGTDCDDANPTVSPTSPEVCDTLDNDCDGAVDEGVLRTFYRDADGDGFGAIDGEVRMGCVPPLGFVESATDCNDDPMMRGALANPGATEDCAVAGDEDCDGAIDEGCGCPGVGASRPCGSAAALASIGDCEPGTQACTSLGGGATAWGPCVGGIEPQPERCGGGDENCNGESNEAAAVDALMCLIDGDRDGYPPAGATSSTACVCPAGTTTRTTPLDCNDGAASVSPMATETCNHVDADCDGRTDETVGTPSCSFARSFIEAGVPGDAARWRCSATGGGTCATAPFTSGRTTPFAFPYFSSSGGGPSAALVSLPQSVDLSGRVRVAGVFWLRQDTPNGQVAVWITPSDTAGPTRTDLNVGGAPTASGSLAAIFDLGSRVLSIRRSEPGGWRTLASSAPASSSQCGISDPDDSSPPTRSLSFELRDDGLSAVLRCNSPAVQATVSTTLSDYRAAYVQGPAFPRFYAGASSGTNVGGLDSGLFSFFLDRDVSTVGDRGPCVPCIDYGVPSLRY